MERSVDDSRALIGMSMHALLVQWVGYVVPWIEALDIVVVLWGVLEAFMGLAQRGWSLAA